MQLVSRFRKLGATVVYARYVLGGLCFESTVSDGAAAADDDDDVIPPCIFMHCLQPARAGALHQ